MKKTISDELLNLFVGKNIQCYKYNDDWGDVTYSLDAPEDAHYRIVLKEIIDIRLVHTIFVINFDDGCLDVYVNDEFELFDTHFGYH